MVNKTVRTLILLIFELLFIWTLFLIFGLHNVLQPLTTKRFPLDNSGFFIIGRSLVSILFLLNIQFGKKIGDFLGKHFKIVLCVSLFLLLFWQLYSCYGGYFISGWDAGIIRSTVLQELRGEYDQIDNNYYSWCPNNLMLIWIFKTVAKTARLFGIENWEYSLVAFQCILDVCAIWLVYVVTFDFTRNTKVAFIAFLSAALFIGLSPWFSQFCIFLFSKMILKDKLY